MFDLGNQEIMKKYPNHKLYDYTSVRTISDINNPEGKIKEMKRDLEIDKTPYSNCRRKNKISIWKNKTSIKVEILFFYKP